MSARPSNEDTSGTIGVSDILGVIARRWRLLTVLMLLGGLLAYGWSRWVATPVYSGHVLLRVAQCAGQPVVPTIELRALLTDPGYPATLASEGAATGSGVRIVYVDDVTGTSDLLVTVEGGSVSEVRRTLELLPASLTRRYGSRFDVKERQSNAAVATLDGFLYSLEADVKETETLLAGAVARDRDHTDDTAIPLLQATLSAMQENVRHVETRLYELTRVPPGSREFVAETVPVVGDVPVRPATPFNVAVGVTIGILLAVLVSLWSVFLTGRRGQAAKATSISGRWPDDT